MSSAADLRAVGGILAGRMTADDVATLRRMIDAFNEGGIDAASPYFAPEIEFHEPPEQPGPGMARGAKATAELFSRFDAAWETHRSEPEEIRTLASGDLLLLSVERFRGRDGIEVAHEAGSIFTFERGRLIKWRAFWDRGAALEAAGAR